jgi:adenine-specific DNA-methyltransferase
VKKGAPHSEAEMKSLYPCTYSYLTRFREVLLSRASHLIISLLKRHAFFVMSGMLPHVFAKYKVIWKRMADDMVSAVIAQHKTPFGYRTVIPTDTISLIATDDEDEAHYLCAVVNSSAVREFIRSYSSAGRGFGTPSVMTHVGVPRFQSTKRLHTRLAQHSRTLHDLQKRGKPDEIGLLEKDVDGLVCELFNIGRG